MIKFEPVGTDKVIISKDDFEHLMDMLAYDESKARKDEDFPAEIAKRLIAGESPVKVFRSYRGLTQETLAAGAGISKSYLCQIETSEREGSAKTLKAIAQVLGVEVDDLI